MTDGAATIPDGSSDGALVARVLDGDREAFAEVYDRYADRLYDFARSMLRNPEDASDAVADAFVAFAEKLPQLREPDRLRPWLYAIVRTECLRRIKARGRIAFGGDDQLVDMADTAAASDELVARSELQQLVWDAAGGLAERDRAILDLHLRQGLDGAELGEAMGVSASNAYVMMNRLRGQLERSLGALLVAKTGRSRLRGPGQHAVELGWRVLAARPQAGGPTCRRLREMHDAQGGHGQPVGAVRRRLRVRCAGGPARARPQQRHARAGPRHRDVRVRLVVASSVRSRWRCRRDHRVGRVPGPEPTRGRRGRQAGRRARDAPHPLPAADPEPDASAIRRAASGRSPRRRR